MIAEIGLACLILAGLTVAAAFFYRSSDADISAFLARAAALQFGLILLSFLCLLILFIGSDFSVRLVADHSHTLKPFLYKIAGAWGNHEGSMLLWVLALSLSTHLFARVRFIAPDLKSGTLRGLFGLLLLFLIFVIATSSPFARLDPAPVEGADLNPLLQDPGLAFHPPLLYLGYVGFSVVFAMALGGLRLGRIDSAWARAALPWTLLAWALLTGGIALGSWWAYYELGWGGFWFWDPVENASLLPWLAGTALLHSLHMLKKREGFQRWVVCLALLAFALSMMGTFLVRSGVLTSVHAFANDPARGVLLLAIMGGTLGHGLLLLARCWHRLPGPALHFSPLSRETMLTLNNLFLTAIAATILTGTLYPLAFSVFSERSLSVGPPYYHATVLPLAVPLFALMALSAFVPWKNTDLASLHPVLLRMAAITLSALILALILTLRGPWLAAPLLALAVWVTAGSGLALLRDRKTYTAWIKIPLSRWGMNLAHGGIGLVLIGMVGIGLLAVPAAGVLAPGDKLSAGPYTVALTRLEDAFGPNYIAARAEMTAHHRPSGARTLLAPEKRHYPAAEQGTTEADIHLNLLGDLYAVMGDPQPGLKGWTIRLWYHPFAGFLWAGYLLVTLAGLLSAGAALRKAREASAP